MKKSTIIFCLFLMGPTFAQTDPVSQEPAGQATQEAPMQPAEDHGEATAANVAAGSLQFGAKAHKALEGKPVTLTITRSGGTSGRVSVDVFTEDGSAKAGSDYTALRRTVTFEDGDANDKKLTILIADDRRIEWPESLKVALKNPSGGAALGAVKKTAVQIVMINNDAVVLGILFSILALVFITSHSPNPSWKKFYGIVPSLLLCYFIPSLFSTAGVISGEGSRLYFVASRYLLPACLALLCLSIDIKGILRLGPKAIIMFLTGTVGIVIGGPLSIFIMSYINPEVVGGEGPNAVWRGMTTVAGSWIGGGANQTAMKEVFNVGDQVFSAMITVDIIVANIWMAVILYMAGEYQVIDKKLKADNSIIKSLQEKIAGYQAEIAKIPNLTDTMKILGIGFAITALGHFTADALAPWIKEVAPILERVSLTSPFFWLIVIATFAGLLLSFTKARELEGAGASRIGTAFLYVLVATIGMKMDLLAILRNPGLFLVGAIWISFHAILLLVVARAIRAPVFFLAVGSQANVGGAASAPIVASAFHPSLAPVGVLLAVFGYALGTVAAWFCGLIMQAVAGG